MDSRPIGVLRPMFAISVMPSRQKKHADGLGFWCCISIKFVLEPLSPWICFSPPARWGLLGFMLVASCRVLLLLSSSPLRPPRPPRRPPPRPRRPPRRPPPPAPLRSMSVCPARPQPRPSMSVFPAGPQPRVSPPSVPCRTSTTTIHAQCSLPDLNHDHPRPVFPAGPQPRPSTPSVPCRTSTASIHAKCSLPDLM